MPEWRFKGNGFTEEKGLDTSDMEIFKKDPMASLAREICQNSIDAKDTGKKTVRIEFKPFRINKNEIPGYDRLLKEIESCRNYQTKKEIVNELSKMLVEIKKESIYCLRISDFNTTGLLGVKDSNNSPFYLLTKGSGISNKAGSKGGSKGIGKFATFVTSQFNTVFYSTYNKENEQGYIGISKLCSTILEGSLDNEKTQGIGYFSNDYKNTPIYEQFKLDESFVRNTYGTDIYILGFKNTNTWKKEVITKILDSFFVAISYGELEVVIDDVVINSETVHRVIENEQLILNTFKNKIKSQYLLLAGKDDVNIKEVDIDGTGMVKILIKLFKREESSLATNECVMIRYPYMKIKTIKSVANIPYSAMCIIQENTLNTLLRSIENPQHTDWEFKRIEDPDMYIEIKNIYKTLVDTIVDYIREIALTGQNIETDIEGASDYLPDLTEDLNNKDDFYNFDINDDKVDENESQDGKIVEKPVIVKTVKNKIKSKISRFETTDVVSAIPELGEIGDLENDSLDGAATFPDGKNCSNTGNIHEGNNTSDTKEGDDDVLKYVQLGGIQYRIFSPNIENGTYIISFYSNYNEDNCELEAYYLDDGEGKYKVNIQEAFVNGERMLIENGKIKKIMLRPGKIKIQISTDLKEFYTWEVKLYANKK